MNANSQVLVTDESLERHGQAGVVYSAAPTVTGKGTKNERSTVDVKMDIDGEIVTFELVPKPQLRVLV